MASRPARHRYCRCGTRLAADNTGQLCAQCKHAARDKLIAPPQVPPEFGGPTSSGQHSLPSTSAGWPGPTAHTLIIRRSMAPAASRKPCLATGSDYASLKSAGLKQDHRFVIWTPWSIGHGCSAFRLDCRGSGGPVSVHLSSHNPRQIAPLRSHLQHCNRPALYALCQ